MGTLLSFQCIMKWKVDTNDLYIMCFILDWTRKNLHENTNQHLHSVTDSNILCQVVDVEYVVFMLR